MRQQKIARQIQRDMADIFSKEAASFLQGAMVTVTAVRVSPDFGYAKIYVSVFPFDRSTAVMAVLDKQNWLLRRSLGQRVHNQLKTVPEIQTRWSISTISTSCSARRSNAATGCSPAGSHDVTSFRRSPTR